MRERRQLEDPLEARGETIPEQGVDETDPLAPTYGYLIQVLTSFESSCTRPSVPLCVRARAKGRRMRQDAAVRVGRHNEPWNGALMARSRRIPWQTGTETLLLEAFRGQPRVVELGTPFATLEEKVERIRERISLSNIRPGWRTIVLLANWFPT